MDEGTFGLFVTNKRRRKYLQRMADGVRHLNRVEPVAPGPQDRPVLTVTTEVAWRVAHQA